MPSKTHLVLLSVSGLATIGCSETVTTSCTGCPGLRVVHSAVSVAAVDVLLNDEVQVEGLAVAMVSSYIALAPGEWAVGFRPSGSTADPPRTMMSFASGDRVTVLTVDSSTVIIPWVLSDTNAVVPTNRSKLRAVHFAKNAAPIDIWRTQPDFGQYVTFQFPILPREVTPYFESDPGDWRVLVSTETRDPDGIPLLADTLLETAPIPVPAGQTRTVLILDKEGGGVTAVVITP
ncbi:MAG: DUF4397 domain-containing protein [Gemmatimonadales bacterium]